MTEITINPVGNGSRQTASQIRTETEATPGAAITGRFAAQEPTAPIRWIVHHMKNGRFLAVAPNDVWSGSGKTKAAAIRAAQRQRRQMTTTKPSDVADLNAEIDWRPT